MTGRGRSGPLRPERMIMSRRATPLPELTRTNIPGIHGRPALGTAVVTQSVTRVLLAKVAIEVRLDGTMERVRNMRLEDGAVTPGNLGDFIFVSHERRSTDDLARDVEHRSASVRMDSFAQAADRSYRKTCFFQSFPSCGHVARLARLHLPSGKLPRKPALFHTAANQQDSTVLNDDGRRDGWTVARWLTHQVPLPREQGRLPHCQDQLGTHCRDVLGHARGRP